MNIFFFLFFFFFFSNNFCSKNNALNRSNILKSYTITSAKVPSIPNPPLCSPLDDCCICLNPVNAGEFRLKCCKKIIHHECLKNYKKTECPMCRAEHSVPPKFWHLFEFSIGEDVDFVYDMESHVIVVYFILTFFFKLFTFIRYKYFS